MKSMCQEARRNSPSVALRRPTDSCSPTTRRMASSSSARSSAWSMRKGGVERDPISEVLLGRKADVVLGQHARGRLGALHVVEPRELEVLLERPAAEVVQELGHVVREVLR